MGNCRADEEGDDTGRGDLLKKDGACTTVGDVAYDGTAGDAGIHIESNVDDAGAAPVEWGGDANATAGGGDE